MSQTVSAKPPLNICTHLVWLKCDPFGGVPFVPLLSHTIRDAVNVVTNTFTVTKFTFSQFFEKNIFENQQLKNGGV